MSFFQTVFEQIGISALAELDKYLFVLPDKPSCTTFEGELSRFAVSEKMVLLVPQTTTLHSFCCQQTQLYQASPIRLLVYLKRAYNFYFVGEEGLEDFRFLGQTLLADFDELDAQLIEPAKIFSALKDEREIDTRFEDFMSVEEKEVVRRYWHHLRNSSGHGESQYLDLIHHLPDIYAKFVELLTEDQLAYKGLIYKQAALSAKAGELKPRQKLVFLGFNKLSKSQVVVLSHCVKLGAHVFWDTPQGQLDTQEVGFFFRQYRRDPYLGPTLPVAEKVGTPTSASIDRIKVAGLVGMARAAGALAEPKVAKDQSVAIVLSASSELKAVLSSLPGAALGKINLNLGRSFLETNTFSFLNLAARWHQGHSSDGRYFYRSFNVLLPILEHPLFAALNQGNAYAMRFEILRENAIRIRESRIAIASPVLRAMLDDRQNLTPVDFLRTLIQTLAEALPKRYVAEHAELDYARRQLNQLWQDVGPGLEHAALLPLWAFFTDVLSDHPIDLESNPEGCLHIVTLAETLGKNYDTLIFLSANEGSLPAAKPRNSLIPLSIRRVYQLSTPTEDNAQAAYLFYRLLAHASAVHLIENTQDNGTASVESSRYMHQLQHLLQRKFDVLPFTAQAQPGPARPLEVAKSPAVMVQLQQYLVHDNPDIKNKSLYPTTLKEYISCPLKFFFRKIMQVKEVDEVTDDLGGGAIGTVLHDTLKDLYEPHVGKEVSAATVAGFETSVDSLVEHHIRAQYKLAETYPIAALGFPAIASRIIKAQVRYVLQVDREAAPFTLLFNESDQAEPILFDVIVQGKTRKAKLQGKFDRVVERNGRIEVLDFKTGSKVNHRFKDWDSLFSEDKKANAEAMQILLYGHLLHKEAGSAWAGKPILPKMIQIKTLGSASKRAAATAPFEMGQQKAYTPITDVRAFAQDIDAQISRVLAELFDERVPFKQTTLEDTCQYCSFAGLCHRN